MSLTIGVTTTVSTESIDALILRFALIPALIAKYAALIEEAAKRYVPVKTGALRASITTHLEAMAAEITAGNDAVDYAAIVEYGGATRAARPYLRPAFEQYAPAFLAELTALIGGV
jgi:HK97 gp10 family phage protein